MVVDVTVCMDLTLTLKVGLLCILNMGDERE